MAARQLRRRETTSEPTPVSTWDSINSRVSKEFERVSNAFKLRDRLETRFKLEKRALKRKIAAE